MGGLCGRRPRLPRVPALVWLYLSPLVLGRQFWGDRDAWCEVYAGGGGGGGHAFPWGLLCDGLPGECLCRLLQTESRGLRLSV